MAKHRFTSFHIVSHRFTCHLIRSLTSLRAMQVTRCALTSFAPALQAPMQRLRSDSTSTALSRDRAFKKAFHTSVDHSHLQTIRNMLYVAELWFCGIIVPFLKCIKCSVRIQASLNLGDEMRMHLQLCCILTHVPFNSAFSAWVLMLGPSKIRRHQDSARKLTVVCHLFAQRGLGPFPIHFTPKRQQK